LPKRYQTWFIKRCFDGANLKTTKNLTQAQKINEKTKHRIIGITLETRPDYITPEEIKRMRKLGCTRVEIGVQAIDDRILKINQRGHDVKTIIQATKLLKEAGFKICYHMMPGLPGSSPKRDLAMFRELFANPDYQPDMLKIYPCVVTKGSELYKLWRKKEYKPYSDKQLIDLLVKIKSIIPPYVRIIRIIRDIPSPKIEGGSKISNLREIVQQEMRKRGLKCRCIRCREIKNLKFKIKDLKLVERKYESSAGKEIFLSYEDTKNDKLVAFLRLRLPNNYSTIRANKRNSIYRDFPELMAAAIIREVHTYGQLVPIGKKRKAAQHLGFGKKLIQEAEKIAKKSGYKKIVVISGTGVREYYRKLGYQLRNTYMVKTL
ncbi:MAG: elongator complex protein 3, partial [Patescibacteria group bacterium]